MIEPPLTSKQLQYLSVNEAKIFRDQYAFMFQLHTLSLPILLLFCSGVSLTAQEESPYHLSLKRELLLVGGGVGTVILGSYLHNQVPDITLAELDLGNIPSFDRFAIDYRSEFARKASNRTRDLSAIMPALLLFGEPSRKDAPKLLLLYAETIAIRRGLTNIIKYTARRPRPYLYNPNLDPATIVRSGDREAFLSGHTSGAAATGFFFGRVFSDYYPDSKLKPYVWGLAAGVPALTGFFRVRAGQHYPSDIVAGYALGAAVGWLVPTLHKKPLLKGRLTLSPSGTGVYATYKLY
jgi:membrane-associated phospholipid phosphatase